MLDKIATAEASKTEQELIELTAKLLSLGRNMVDCGSRNDRLAIMEKTEESLRQSLSELARSAK